LRGNPRAIVHNFHHRAIVFAVSADPQLTFSAHRINGIVDQVGPDLVEFASKGMHQQRRLLVIPLHGHAALEFVIQDCKRGLQCFHDIHVLDGGLVHERVFLDRSYQIGDSRSAAFNLVQQICDLQGSRDPHERRSCGPRVERTKEML
jgi:hypothetical protein